MRILNFIKNLFDIGNPKYREACKVETKEGVFHLTGSASKSPVRGAKWEYQAYSNNNTQVFKTDDIKESEIINKII